MKKIKSPLNLTLIGIAFFLLNSFIANAQVGINTVDPKTTLDVNGAIALREGPALTLSNGINNDIDLGTQPFSFYRITGPTADFSISGLIPASGADGQIVMLQNTTSQNMTILNQSGSSGTNQIFVPSDQDLLLRGINTTITLQYNASISKWTLLDKHNHIETWYHGPINIASGTNVITVSIPEATYASSAFVNFAGTVPSADAANLSLNYVEVATGGVVFSVRNASGATINNISFVITINKVKI